MIQTKRLPFYKKKENEIRIVYFGEKGIEALKEVYKNTKDIIFEKDNVIFPSVKATKSVQGKQKSKILTKQKSLQEKGHVVLAC